jgi:integrase
MESIDQDMKRTAWAGGRVMVTKDGRQRWILERMVAGTRPSITLNVTSERDALAELALFQRDPAKYIGQSRLDKAQRGAGLRDGVFLSETIFDALAAHQESEGASQKHIQDTRRYLMVWLAELGGRTDLRLVTASRVTGVLDSQSKPKQRSKRRQLMSALATLCAYLKPRGLDPAQSPARWLEWETVKPIPGKLAGRRHHSAAVLQACYSSLAPQAMRDTLRLMACYGLHLTEVGRIAAGDNADLASVDHGVIKGKVGFFHEKAKRVHVISLDGSGYAAAVRLRALGRAPNDGELRRALRDACRTARCDRVKAAFLRHSFVTLAKEGGRIIKPQDHGLSLEEIAAVTGHTNTNTTRDFYDGSDVPPLVVIPLSLTHPEDQSPSDTTSLR